MSALGFLFVLVFVDPIVMSVLLKYLSPLSDCLFRISMKFTSTSLNNNRKVFVNN